MERIVRTMVPSKSMIKALTNPRYFHELLRLTERSRKSITVVNYLAELSGRKDDPVLVLAKALIDARKRGAAVSVILEGSRLENNYPFYRMLKDKGCDVWLDTSKTMIHQKAFLFDGAVLVAGSHNLTVASLLHGEELSLATDDPGAIRVMRRALEAVVRQREQIRGDVTKDVLPLPAALLRNVMAPLYGAHSDNALDLYMMFCMEDGGRPKPIAIDAEKWGRALGFDPGAAGKHRTEKYLKYYFQQRIGPVLRQLGRHGIVAVDRGKDTVTRERMPESGGRIEVPETFWRFGWLTRLSFAAKYFYFISLAETGDSPFYPWWSLSIRKIVKKYGCDASIRKGALELEKYGILEILRALPRKRGKYYSEEAQYYRLNPFKPIEGP
jgi:hypothetical protein